MGLQLITPPAVEPVSLEELKEFCRIDLGDTSQDNTLLGLALAARYHCENFTKKRFMKQQWALFMDFFPGYIDLKIAGAKVSSPFVSGSNAVLVGIRYAIVLPFPPVRSIDLFQYLNANGDTTPLNEYVGSPPSGGYVKDIISNPARLIPPFGQMWPVARVVVNAVEVQFTTGYADSILVNATAGSNQISIAGSPPGYAFQATDVGRLIYIPGAGPIPAGGSAASTLSTIITAVAGLTATIRDAAQSNASPPQPVTAIIVNGQNANPGHWELIRTAIKLWVSGKYAQRLPDKEVKENVDNLLWPVRDLRF